MERLLVTYKSRYDFEGNKGASVEILTPNVSETDKVGFQSAKMKLSDIEVFNQFTVIPAVYEVELGMKASSGQKTAIVIKSAKIVKEISLQTAFVATEKNG